MNIRDLQYLVAVAEHQHFGKAAEACFVSQPTLSMQLKKLEETLGVTVFERTNKQVFLTDNGNAIVKQAKHILNEVDNLKTIALQCSDPLAGDYKVGIIPTLAPYLLPKVLTHIKKALPKLKLYILEEKTDQLLTHIRKGELDAVILALPVPTEGLHSTKLFDESFYIAMPKQHPLAKKVKITINDLQKEKLMLLEEGHCLRDQALDVCRINQNQQNEFNATSLETLWQMVASGVGITLVPALSLESKSIPSSLVTIKKLSGSKPKRTISMLWRKQSIKTDVHHCMAEVIKLHLNL